MINLNDKGGGGRGGKSETCCKDYVPAYSDILF